MKHRNIEKNLYNVRIYCSVENMWKIVKIEDVLLLNRFLKWKQFPLGITAHKLTFKEARELETYVQFYSHAVKIVKNRSKIQNS